MSPGDDRDNCLVGINWGSSNFRAFLIAAGGRLLDSYALPAGVTQLDRQGMIDCIAALVDRWPDHGRIIASGMIGSNVGWEEAAYVEAPADVVTLAAGTIDTSIGATRVMIVPGVACRRTADDAPDVMRGEELEIVGLGALGDPTDGLVALPGTHTKWVRLDAGGIAEFSTAMSGEIYDRLTTVGLLASVVTGEASVGDAFRNGLELGLARQLGLSATLFGVRARVLRGDLHREDAASFTRGLLIGSEIADALILFPDARAATVTLLGSATVRPLYAAALDQCGFEVCEVDSEAACIAGYTALERALSSA